MTSEYTVRRYPHGVALFSMIPADDLAHLISKSIADGWDQIHAGIADAIGASLVFTSKEDGAKWLAELASSGDWLKSGDTGASSRTIYSVMTGKPCLGREGAERPIDPDDFGRCHLLLQLHPEWVARLPEVAAKYPAWGPLVREWARMTAIYERDLQTGASTELYDLMRELREEAQS